MSVILIVVTGYIAIATLLFLSQSRFLYFPIKDILRTPADLGLDYTSVSFSAADGVTLAGWYVSVPHPHGTVLVCHGNGGNISYLLDTIQQYALLDYDCFVFDYRGYGASHGKPTEQGTYDDAEAAWQYLTMERGIAPSSIVLVGRSLGGAIAAWLAQHVRPRALVIESAFTSIPDIAAETYWFLPARLLARFKYDTREYLRHVQSPVLVVHSRDDELIPFHHGNELFESATGPKELLEIAGGHNEGFFLSTGRYTTGLQSFLARHPSHP